MKVNELLSIECRDTTKLSYFDKGDLARCAKDKGLEPFKVGALVTEKEIIGGADDDKAADGTERNLK